MSNRRDFIKKAGLSMGAMALASPAVFGENTKASTENTTKFKLKYAPPFGMFEAHAGKDLFDQIKFMDDQGFKAMFDNGLPGREPAVQEKIASALANRNMDMGPFVLYADFGVTSFVEDSADVRQLISEKIVLGVEVARRTGAKQALMVPGRFHEKLDWDYQTNNVIQNLKFCMEQLNAFHSELTIVIEPLNSHVDHPGLFLTKIPQAYMICNAVNDARCKIVNDLYHQQIQEGNLINNLKMAYNQIGAFHVGDNPGRKEPTSGEINYRNIFKTLHEMNYDGTICMEHGKSINGLEGEKALLKAYRFCDDF